MRIIDPIANKPIDVAQIYLTAGEALLIKQRLDVLLRDPEALEHFHICNDAVRDLSFSIVTPAKLAAGGYTALEQLVLAGICDP